MSNQSYRLKKIKVCRSCKLKKLVNILSLGKLYLSDFTINDIKPKKFPLDLVLCKNCSLLQLRHTAPQAALYTERYGYKSGINQTVRNELREIVNEALRRIKDQKVKELVVLDIGANDGTLLSNYPKNIFRVGAEPIRKFARQCSAHANVVVNDFFNYESFVKKLNGRKAHIITAIACFYDIDSPNQFLSDVKKILDKDGIFVIQQNYLVGMLEQNALDNSVHEHLAYYSLLSLENLLKRHNLEVFDAKEVPINGGSFRTFIAFKGKRNITKNVKDMRIYEGKLKLDQKKIYRDFAKRIRKNRDNLHGLILDLVKKNKRIYVYGASTRGNTLLQFCKLDKRLIKAAVERNPEKWGKKIASVGIPIISEEQARKDKPDYMIVIPWFFKEEFLKRERRYLDSGGHFIFPLPKLEVI